MREHHRAGYQKSLSQSQVRRTAEQALAPGRRGRQDITVCRNARKLVISRISAEGDWDAERQTGQTGHQSVESGRSVCRLNLKLFVWTQSQPIRLTRIALYIAVYSVYVRLSLARRVHTQCTIDWSIRWYFQFDRILWAVHGVRPVFHSARIDESVDIR